MRGNAPNSGRKTSESRVHKLVKNVRKNRIVFVLETEGANFGEKFDMEGATGRMRAAEEVKVGFG